MTHEEQRQVESIANKEGWCFAFTGAMVLLAAMSLYNAFVVTPLKLRVIHLESKLQRLEEGRK